MKIKLHKNDLPNNINFGESIAIDTEAMGLNHARDRLCLVQLSSGNGVCHLVQMQNNGIKPKNLIKLLKNKKILKIFHYARFDVGLLKYALKINIENIYCTNEKIKTSKHKKF